MFYLKYIGLPAIQATEIHRLCTCISGVLDNYEKLHDGFSLSSEERALSRDMVPQFLALRQKGLSLSLLFFLVQPFIEACKSQNQRRENAICQLLEDHSWVYNRKALIVLRDLAVEKQLLAAGPTGTLDTSCYHSLKGCFSEFLTHAGDPSLFYRNLSKTETVISLLFGWKPSAQERLSLQTATSSRLDIGRKDSILFSVITKYLNLEGLDAEVLSQKEALEATLEQHTIYSGRLLRIIANHDGEDGVNLVQFLASEYLSLRSKIVVAILDSCNTSLLPTLLTAEQLSKEPEEDVELKQAAFHKLLNAKDPSLYWRFAKIAVDQSNREALRMIFGAHEPTIYSAPGDGTDRAAVIAHPQQGLGPITDLQMTCLKALESHTPQGRVLVSACQEMLCSWIERLIESPLRERVREMPLPMVKQLWPALSAHLEISNSLPIFFDSLSGRDVPFYYPKESKILSAFGGKLFPFFVTELIKMRLEWMHDDSTSGQKISEAFLCQPNAVAPFVERFSDFHTWPFKMKNVALQLLSYRNPITVNSWLSVAMLKIVLKDSVPYREKHPKTEPVSFVPLSQSSHSALMNDEPGLHHKDAWIGFYSYWKDTLLQYGLFNTECHDRDRFQQAVKILAKIETRIGQNLVLESKPRIVLSRPKEILSQMTSAIDALLVRSEFPEGNPSFGRCFELMPLTQTGYYRWMILDPENGLNSALGRGWDIGATDLFREHIYDFCHAMDMPTLLSAYQAQADGAGIDAEQGRILVISTMCMLPYTNAPAGEVLGVQAHVLGLLKGAVDPTQDMSVVTLIDALHTLPVQSQKEFYAEVQSCLQTLSARGIVFEKTPKFERVLLANNGLKTCLSTLFEVNCSYLDSRLPIEDKQRVLEILSCTWLLNISGTEALALHDAWQSAIVTTLIDLEYEIKNSAVLAAIDSLWGSNLLISDVLGLVTHWETVWGDNKMIGLRPSAKSGAMSSLPLVTV